MAEVNELSPARNELFAALSKAQAEMHLAKKDTDNPFFKSKYADLGAVWEVARPALTKYGLCITQLVEHDSLITVLGHSSGQFISSRLPLRPMKPDPQAMGACITYMRRFALSAICCVATEDDDGNAASGHDAPRPIQPPPKATIKIPLKPEAIFDSKSAPIASQPAPTQVHPDIAQPTRDDLNTLLKEGREQKGWTNTEITDVLQRMFGLASSKDISMEQFLLLRRIVNEKTYTETCEKMKERSANA